ncbi:MAG: alpha/beta hydrolase [Pseudomonadota bacterium]
MMLYLLQFKFFREFMRLSVRWQIRWKWRGHSVNGISVSDRRIAVKNGDIGLRIYTPEGSGPFPVMVFYHGGGWVGCDLHTHDPTCRELCARGQHIVVSVDYRLAPEFLFPCAPNDCLEALDWVRMHGPELNADIKRLVVCGDSAGGNLAAVVAIKARTQFPGLIKGQVLIYPVTDHYSAKTASFVEFADDKGLSAEGVVWLWETYLGKSTVPMGHRYQNDLATPLTCSDLKGLPPALVITAERDVLRDEGIAYAQKLADHGVAAKQTTYPGAQHGFLSSNGLSLECVTALNEIADWLRVRNY